MTWTWNFCKGSLKKDHDWWRPIRGHITLKTHFDDFNKILNDFNKIVKWCHPSTLFAKWIYSSKFQVYTLSRTWEPGAFTILTWEFWEVNSACSLKLCICIWAKIKSFKQFAFKMCVAKFCSLWQSFMQKEVSRVSRVIQINSSGHLVTFRSKVQLFYFRNYTIYWLVRELRNLYRK